MADPLILLQMYGYVALFPLAVIEGPIITIIAGLLVTAGVFNPYAVYLIVVTGDIVGDSVWYAVGRFGGGPFTRALKRMFNITDEKITATKDRFETHRIRMTMLSKLTHGIGFAGLVAAGVVRVSYLLFVFSCLVVTLFQCAVFLSIGLFFGSAYHIIEQYLNHFAAFTICAAVVVVIFGAWYRFVRRH